MSANTDFFPPKVTEPELREHLFRLLGTGAADPTVEVAPGGVTVTRTAEGVIRIAYDRNPGVFVNWSPGLGAATPADVKGHTLVRDTYDSTNKRLDISLFDDADAADDLDATEYIDLVLRFKETDV